MNLEEVEQESLTYLGQATNPLVRISTLHQHVADKLSEAIPSLVDFTEFLEQHELVKVTDPMAMSEDNTAAEMLEESGLPTSPCAILTSRVPSGRDLGMAMVDQLSSITEALTGALGDARGTGDTVRAQQIYETLERVKKLKDNIVGFIKSS